MTTPDLLAIIAIQPGRTCCELCRTYGFRADTLSSKLRRMAARKQIRRRLSRGQRKAVKAYRYFPVKKAQP